MLLAISMYSLFCGTFISFIFLEEEKKKKSLKCIRVVSDVIVIIIQCYYTSKHFAVPGTNYINSAPCIRIRTLLSFYSFNPTDKDSIERRAANSGRLGEECIHQSTCT